MLYDDISEYDAAIAETKAAISRVLQAGQSRTIGSAGSSRATTESELSDLRRHLQKLQKEKTELQSGKTGAVRLVPGW